MAVRNRSTRYGNASNVDMDAHIAGVYKVRHEISVPLQVAYRHL